jgi:hypothetical protein
MSNAAENIPYHLRAIGAEEVGGLLGCSARSVLELHACKAGFPARVSIKPATWIAGEILEYRDANRAGLRVRRRSSRSRG